jgi:hypothetical protein
MTDQHVAVSIFVGGALNAQQLSLDGILDIASEVNKNQFEVTADVQRTAVVLKIIDEKQADGLYRTYLYHTDTCVESEV